MTTTQPTPTKKKSGEKITLRFNDHAYNTELTRVESIAHLMDELGGLLAAAGIPGVNVTDLLANPHKAMIPHAPEDVRRFIANLQNEKLYNWAALPAINAIIQWAEANAGNATLSGYWTEFEPTGRLKAEFISGLRERHTIYCASDVQAKVLEKVQAAAKLLNEAQVISSPWLDTYGDRSELTRPFLREGRNYAVNTEFISTL